MTDRFNLAYEAHDLHLFENQPDALKDLLLGKSAIIGDVMTREFRFITGHMHGMHGRKDMYYKYHRLALSSNPLAGVTTATSYNAIQVEQRFYTNGDITLEISMSVVPGVHQPYSELGAVMDVYYSSEDEGKLPKGIIGKNWAGSSEDAEIARKQLGLIQQDQLLDEIDVDATARNVLLAAQRKDFLPDFLQILAQKTS